MNSNTGTWDTFVNAGFSGSATDIRDRVFHGPAPTPNAKGVYCYRLQFGYYDAASTRMGLEGVTATNSPGYLNDPNNPLSRCGDFETFDELGQEIDDAITLLLGRHLSAEIVLVGHSRGGLAARAFLQKPAPLAFPKPPPSPTKAAIVGLLTTSSPHLGSRMGRVYEWLQTHQRGEPGTDADDWDVVDFLNQAIIFIPPTQFTPGYTTTKPTIDVRRPVIMDVADDSVAIYSLNARTSLQELPTGIINGEIVHYKAPLGLMSLSPIKYSVLDSSLVSPGGLLLEQLSSNAVSFILGPDNTPNSLRGDGLIPAENQRFTQLSGFSGIALLPHVVTADEVVHTDAPHRTFDLLARLKVVAPGWFP